ncbi:MAG: flagellar M-ring protein FliF C-terminal domain-containing protein [Eubacteriales bacterium]|nr:flagellar M-ring protein FliF C-terminal domain-containing protein [Eubacteriales bacterium]
MADRLRQIPQKLMEIWNDWTTKQKITIVGSTAAFIAVVVVLAVILTRPKYEVLVNCEDYTEMNSVTSLLSSNNHAYKITDMTVKVKKGELTDCKMLIASEDIQSEGYSFEDAMSSSFTTTESDKTKQYAHYLESKFASDLSDIDGVKSATVAINIPDTTNSFYQTASEATVSVRLVTTKEIGEDTAESIASFLATGVGNSSTKSITIIDNKGNTLFNGAAGNGTSSGVSYNSKLKYKSQIEATTKSSLISNILATGLYDDAVVTLNYELDWDTVNKVAKEYEAQEGREEGLYSESYELNSTGTNGASGTPGTVSNSNDTTTYDITDGTSSSSVYTVKQYSYLPNELVTTTTSEPGSIVKADSTIAVTLVKNVTYEETQTKKLGYLDGTDWATFKSENVEPVALAVDDTWIDIISKGTGIDPANISVVAYQRNSFEDKAKTNILNTASFWVQIVLAIAILGILVLVVIRSARPLTVEEKEPELSVEEMLATTRENQPTVDDIDLQEKSETRKAIEKFVDENPEAVALLLRNWLNDDW